MSCEAYLLLLGVWSLGVFGLVLGPSLICLGPLPIWRPQAVIPVFYVYPFRNLHWNISGGYSTTCLPYLRASPLKFIRLNLSTTTSSFSTLLYLPVSYLRTGTQSTYISTIINSSGFSSSSIIFATPVHGYWILIAVPSMQLA